MNEEEKKCDIRPEVLNYDDLCNMVPKLAKFEKPVKWLMKALKLTKCNETHARLCDTPGYKFCDRLLFEELKVRLRIDGVEVLDNLPEGAFITVSNHPFGAIDGVTLIDIFGFRRPRYKVMVNMLLNHISAMRPNFIAVDAWKTDDPERRKQSVRGIREAMKMLANGEPVGFFPAGAMSKVNKRLRLQDREWQDSVLQIIYRAKVPVIPVFFHGTNSWWFNFLGVTCWQARSLWLPRELFRKAGKEIHVSIGKPIMPDEQSRFETPRTLGDYLREKTYELRGGL